MRNGNLYREISKEILDLIGTSNIPTGGRLPSVRSLAKEFGVSYAVVRQALIALEAQGLLEIRDRYGTYVCDKFKFSSYGIPEFGSFDLIETIALVLAEAAAVAAPIISQESVLELEELISNENRRKVSNIKAHSAFHSLIVRSTNNEVLILLTETLWQMQNSDVKLRDNYLEIFNSKSQCFEKERVAILAALKRRDSDGARKAMRLYFNCFMDALLITAEERAYQEVKRKTSNTRSRFLLSTQLS